jgi:hypothetical protein
VARLCNHFGFAFSYWEYSAGFGLYDAPAKKWREELTSALFSTNPISDDEGYKLGDENLIRNPNFASGSINWSFWCDQSGSANNAVTNEGYSVTVTKVPSNTWEIQVIQSNLPLEGGKSYLLSFDVFGDEGMALYANVQINVEPYTSWGGVNVTLPARNVTAIIQAPQEISESVNLIFNFGFTTGKAVISNVSLKEMLIDDNTPVMENDKGKISIKNHKVFISKNVINSAPFSEFQIVSANGKVLYSGKCDENGKAFIKEMPKGVYVINVKNIVSLKYNRK